MKTMKQCPYCKIDFSFSPWAATKQPKIICHNCRNYCGTKKRQKDDRDEEEAMKKKYGDVGNW